MGAAGRVALLAAPPPVSLTAGGSGRSGVPEQVVIAKPRYSVGPLLLARLGPAARGPRPRPLRRCRATRSVLSSWPGRARAAPEASLRRCNLRGGSRVSVWCLRLC